MHWATFALRDIKAALLKDGQISTARLVEKAIFELCEADIVDLAGNDKQTDKPVPLKRLC